MGYSIKLMTLAEEKAEAKRKARKKFTVKEIAVYLEVDPRTVLAAIRRLQMPVDGKLARGQASRLISHIRERQGHQILQQTESKRKVTFLG